MSESIAQYDQPAEEFKEWWQSHQPALSSPEAYVDALQAYRAGWNDAVRMLQILDENAEEIRKRRGVSDGE